VVGATLLFLGDRWDALGRAGRVSIIAAIAVVLCVAGVVVRSRATSTGAPPHTGDNLRRRLASTLLTAGAAAAGFATYAGLEGTGPDGSDPRGALLLASAVTLVVMIAGYLLAHSALGQLGIAVAAATAYGGVLEVAQPDGNNFLGLGLVGLGVVWAVLTWRRLVGERRFGYAIAVSFGLIGAQLLALDSEYPRTAYLGYVLTALVAAACFTAYALLRDWVLLAGGVVGSTLVVPEFLYDVTNGSLGASGVMLVAGVTLLAGSLAGLRIRQQPEPEPEAPPAA
jgi:hypothetical protein